jgi:hypothetical protein
MYDLVDALVHGDQRAVGQDIDRQQGKEQQPARQQPRVPLAPCAAREVPSLAGPRSSHRGYRSAARGGGSATALSVGLPPAG